MINTRALRAMALAWSLFATPAVAEQASTVLPITGPHSMAEYSGLLNDALLAMLSCNSGSSAPANGVGGLATHFQCWADTTTNPVVVKIYDGSQWVPVAKLNTSSHIWTPVYQGTDTGTASTATSGTSGHVLGFLDGANTWSGNQSFNSGTMILKGSSSGTTTVQPAAAASGVITIPSATDTLMGKATVDSMTNKTFDTAATGNSLLINGLAATANTGTGAVVRGTSPTLAAPALGAATASSVAIGGATIGSNGFAVSGSSAFGGPATHTSNSANALAVGLNGSTNPAFNIDASTASSATGLNIKSAASGAGVAVAAISSATNEALSVNAKGSGALAIGGTSTGGVSLGNGGGGVSIGSALTYGGVTLNNAVTGTGNMVLATAPSIAGGALSGTFTGAPTLSGNLTFAGVPILSGLSAGTCATGTGLDASNNLIKVSCPGAATSVQVGTTNVTSCSTANGFLYVSGGILQCQLTTPTTCVILSTSATTCSNGGSQANNGTYTTPAGVRWIEVHMVGGGSSGQSSGTSGTSINSGSATTFGTSLFTANGGSGGAGGTATGGLINAPGQGGSPAIGGTASNPPGSLGGNSFYSGAGVGVSNGAGNAAVANSGSGGAGGGGNTSVNTGTGGGAGAYLYGIVTSPGASYSYAVGAGGSTASAGASGSAGGAGGAGRILIIEHYGTWLLKRDLDPAANDNSPMWLNAAA